MGAAGSFANLGVVGGCTVYALTGAIGGLLAQWQGYQGMKTEAGLIVLAVYTAELVAFTGTFRQRAEPFPCCARKQKLDPPSAVSAHRPNKLSKPPASFHPGMILVALTDVVGLVLCYVGLQVSSLLWTSGYAILTLLAAVWRRVFLKRTVDPLQWIGVLLILVGVLVQCVWTLVDDMHKDSVMGLSALSNTTTAAPPGPAFSGTNLLAIGIGVLSALAYSANFCLVEWVQAPNPNSIYGPPESLTILSFTGMVGFALNALYILVYTIPNWNELVANPVNASGGDVIRISWMWLLSAVAVFLHFWSFYRVCTVSSVHAGISKALESAVLFICSDLLFCDAKPAINVPGSKLNCLDAPKGVSIAMYFLGIAVYVYGQYRLHQRLNVKGHSDSDDLEHNLLDDVVRDDCAPK